MLILNPRTKLRNIYLSENIYPFTNFFYKKTEIPQKFQASFILKEILFEKIILYYLHDFSCKKNQPCHKTSNVNLSHKGPRPLRGVHSVGVFLRDLSPYLCEFQRKPRRTPNGWVDTGSEPGTSGLSVLSAEPLGHW